MLVTPSGMRLLSYAESKDLSISSEASDFENLETLLQLMPSLVGSGYHTFFRIALEMLFSEETDPTECRADLLWERALPVLMDATLTRLTEPLRPLRVTDVSELIAVSSVPDPSLSSLSEYTDHIEAIVRESDAVLFDGGSFTFRSPDPYHAEEAFSKWRSGSDEFPSLRPYLTSQLLRVTGEFCCRYDRPLLLKGDATPDGFGKMIPYLKKNNRLPRLLYCVPMNGAREVGRRYREAEAVGLLSEISGVVPCDLLYQSSAALLDGLWESARCYPLGKHCFLAEGETSAELRVGFERFLSVLSEILTKELRSGEATEEALLAVGRRVLTGEILS